MIRAFAVFIASVVAMLAWSGSAYAHKPSDSYLSLRVDGALVHVRWDIAVRDLDYALDLDRDGDSKVTWGELRDRQAEISAYAARALTLQTNDVACPTTADDASQALTRHSDGAYVVLHFTARCGSPVRSLGVDYRLFLDLDPQHRGLLNLDAGGTTTTHIFKSSDHVAAFSTEGRSRLRQFGVIVREGIFHIWTGYDHVLFLLALLLPSVLRRERGAWVPVPRLRTALLDVLRIVTAFTLAHSITLSLAALGVVTLPSRLVESAIAASVVLAAANNVYPVLNQDRWVAAFILGLMHGFGFSATLTDLDLPRSSLVSTLFGFNVGVEIGQASIVCVFVPLAFAARRSTVYRRWILVGGSVVVAAIATVWFIERAFAIRLF
jgi:hypothetical protein